MNHPTLILPPRYTEDSIALWKAAISAGWQVERLSGWRLNKEILRPAIVFGEPLFAFAIAEQLSLALLGPTADWLIQIPPEFVKRQITFTTVGQLTDYKFPMFVKPPQQKDFTAQIYSAPHDLAAQPKDAPILVAEPVHWLKEFRCFVCERQVTTLSIYSRAGEIARTENDDWAASQSETDEALEFARSVLRDRRVELPAAAVVDVGVIDGRGWAIVEANPVWASGIYGCQASQVLQTLTKACLPTQELDEEQRRWVTNPIE